MKKFIVNKNVLIIAVALIVYYIIMELYYMYFIGLNYDVYRFFLEPNTVKYIETKAIFLAFLFFTILISRASPFIYANFILLIVFFLVPTLVIYSFSNQIRGPLYSIVALLTAVGLVAFLEIKTPELRAMRLSDGIFAFIIWPLDLGIWDL